MYIDSPGGPIKESLPIISTMNGIKCPIATFCRGDAGGSAAVIAAHGAAGFRVAAPSARFSFRRPGTSRAEHDLVSDERLLLTLAEILAKDVRKMEKEVLSWLTTGADLTADQALTHHLIDRVSAKPLMPVSA